jgi:hypothetical protein
MKVDYKRRGFTRATMDIAAMLIVGSSVPAAVAASATPRPSERVSRLAGVMSQVDSKNLVAFLREWNELAVSAVTQMLRQYGLMGPPGYGIAEVVRNRIPNKPGLLDEVNKLLGPNTLQARLESDAELKRAHAQLEEVERLVQLETVDFFAWSLIRQRGLGSASASEDAIASAEARLQRALPPSYRQLLSYTKGWLTTSSRLSQIEHADTFARCDPESVQDWTEHKSNIPDSRYFVYGDKQEPYNIRVEYLPNAVLISRSKTNERLLLNPAVVSETDEWEAWYLHPRIAGAIRYRSLFGLLQFLRESDKKAYKRIV